MAIQYPCQLLQLDQTDCCVNLSVEEDDGNREDDGGEADGETKVGDPVGRTLQLGVEVIFQDSPHPSLPPEVYW